MILECACGKMYRVKDDATNLPTRCPACGGSLRRTGGAPPAGDAGRARELEARVKELERQLEASRPSGGVQLSVESIAAPSLSNPIAELRAAAAKADRFERELVELRGRLEKALSEKEHELAAAVDGLSRSEAERRKLETRAAALEEGHTRALEGKDKTIQALDASIGSYRAKVDELQKRVDALEAQRLNDLSHFDASLRQREQSDRNQLDKTTQSHQKSLTDLRAELESRIIEKDRQITDSRQALDREAGERRRLQETLNRLQGSADRTVAEKDASIAALNATLDSYKSKLETVQKRLESLEELRRSEQDATARRVRDGQALRARLEEAEHLAGDLDHGADAIEAALATLRDRSRRMKATLHESVSGTGESPLRGEMPALPAPPPEEFNAMSDLPAPAPEPAPAAPSTRRWKKTPPELIAPVPEEGRVEEPSGVFQVVRDAAPAPEPEPEPRIEIPLIEETAPPPVEPAPAILETPPAPSEDLPLISPPEEEAGTKAAAPPAKQGDTARRRFSWQKK